MVQKDNRRIVLAIAAYSSASILGPMLFFGILGFFLDKYFNSNPKFLLIGIGVAFIFSNILLFKKKSFLLKNKLIESDSKKESKNE